MSHWTSQCPNRFSTPAGYKTLMANMEAVAKRSQPTTALASQPAKVAAILPVLHNNLNDGIYSTESKRSIDHAPTPYLLPSLLCPIQLDGLTVSSPVAATVLINDGAQLVLIK